MTKIKPEISVIVPVYNEAGNITKLHKEMLFWLLEMKRTFEVIYVDDGSTDNTGAELGKLKKAKVVTLKKNCGQSTALEIGIHNSNGKIIITLDGDGQNNPSDFKALVIKLEEGYDAVCGWRHNRQDPNNKKIVSRGAKFIRKTIINDGVHDAGCTLRAYWRYCFDDVHLYGELHRMIPALLLLKGFIITEIKVDHRPRRVGITKYNSARMFNGFLDIIQVWITQKYNKRPLYLFGTVGIILIFFSVILLITLMFLRLFLEYHLSDKIWPLVGVTGFLTGIQLMIFGFISDLIIRNNNEWLSAPIKSIKSSE